MTDDLVTRRDEMQARFDALGGWDGISDMLQNAMDRIKADAATIARLEGERERLALAICGGEDAPVYANAQPVEALEKVARDNAAAAMWQIDRTMKAEAQVAALVEALERSADYIEKGMRDRSGPILRQARAAVTAAKEVK